jgi:TonB family protein
LVFLRYICAMPKHPMSAPEPFDSQSEINPAEKIGPKNVSVPPPARPAPTTVQAHADDASFETDFADLAARFAAKSGGGLSPELSADLALEIVLNEIVEQACLATGATGAAVVLRRNADMICRATSGTTSPDLGSRLDMSGGLSGECVKTLRTVRCDDALADKRADVEASRRLGVRSVMVMPLLRDTEMVGAFELFSSRVSAFSERDERTLEVLAARTLRNLTRASQAIVLEKATENANEKPTVKPLPAPGVKAANETSSKSGTGLQASGTKLSSKSVPSDSGPDVEALREALKDIHSDEIPSEDLGGDGPDDPWWKRDFTTLALTAAVLVCTLMLGVVVAKHFQIRQRMARAHAAPTVAAATAPQANPSPNATVAPASEAGPADPSTSAPASTSSRTNGITIRPTGRSDLSSVPPGGLRIYDNGKEVFRATPPPIPSEVKGNGKGSVVQQAAAIEPERVVQLSAEAAEGDLVRRVEPVYPEQARAQRIQGAVVLDVHIGPDGVVEGAQVVSGDPLLAQASTDAVKQWRFKPHTENRRPVRMQTRVTLNFRLPQ